MNLRLLRLIVFSAPALLLLPRITAAKAKCSHHSLSCSFQSNSTHSQRIEQFEQSLTPILQAKIDRGLQKATPHKQSITQADITFLARNWSSFSPAFRSLYQGIYQIPSSFSKYVSPSGNFEIYYTLQGEDSVPSTDTYGYGFEGDWRVLVHGPNGIPDYVDETAWAFDSSWAMEVQRFAFPAPYGYKNDRFPSERYKVVINKQADDYYGLTYISTKISADRPGFRSIIHMRNEWEGWDNGGVIDYESHPEKGIRITAAHEFFHAVQYSLIHSSDLTLDYMPVSWLEGTAVLMEELAFDYVNDYTQYVNGFFRDPTLPILGGMADGYVEYKNSIVAIYLYESVYEEPSIAFIRDVFMLNYARALPFDQLLEAASAQAQRSWPDIISSFFAESYFSGTRARPDLFISEAENLWQWTYTPDILHSTTKEISSYGMQVFSYGKTSHDPDSLVVFIEESQAAMSQLGIKAVLLDEHLSDTIIEISFDEETEPRGVIRDWNLYDTALVIVVNTNPLHALETTVSFVKKDGSSMIRTDRIDVFPNPVTSGEEVNFRGITIQDVTIFTMNGNVVAKIDKSRDTTHTTEDGLLEEMKQFTWNGANSAGKRVVCGTYIAFVGYKEYEGSRETFHKRYKILVKP